MTDEPIFGEEPDAEIQDAVENLGKVISEKAGKEMQKKLDAMNTDQIKERILKQAADAFGNGCNAVIQTFASMKVINEVPADILEDLIKEHAKFQVKVLSWLGLRFDGPDEGVMTVYEAETNALKELIATHSGGHPGCILDEYRKRTEEEWPEDLEVQGGVS